MLYPLRHKALSPSDLIQALADSREAETARPSPLSETVQSEDNKQERMRPPSDTLLCCHRFMEEYELVVAGSGDVRLTRRCVFERAGNRA